MDDATVDIARVNRPYATPPRTLRGRAWLWLMRLVGQARRQVLCRLRPGYVAMACEQRQGDCRQCGSCCHLTFRCPFWQSDGLCRIYERRTRTCRAFPIDALDLRLTRVPCGYYFVEPGPEAADRADPAD